MTYQQVNVFLFIPEDVLLLIASLQLFCPFLIFSETFAAVIKQQMCYGLLRSQIPSLGLIFSMLFLSSPPLRFVLPLSVTSCPKRFWQQAICLSTLKEKIWCNTSRSQLIRMMWMSTKQVENVVSLILAMAGYSKNPALHG